MATDEPAARNTDSCDGRRRKRSKKLLSLLSRTLPRRWCMETDTLRKTAFLTCTGQCLGQQVVNPERKRPRYVKRSGLQRLVEHERVDVACLRVVECSRESADDFETSVLPKYDRPLVRADDEVELHASVALRLRVFE